MVVRKMKEKCKDAARMRREKERAEFVELSKLLPLPSSTTSQLDKASIIRLTSSYLRMRAAFPQGLGENWGNEHHHHHHHNHHHQQQQQQRNRALNKFSGHQQQQQQQQRQFHLPNNSVQSAVAEHANAIHDRVAPLDPSQQVHVKELGSLILQTLDGFVFALHSDGKIMYISETASVHLGLPQIDLTGSSVFEYVHPSDHNDIYEILSLSEAEKAHLNSTVAAQTGEPSSSALVSLELGRSFCMRMKCILPKRNAGLVSSGYKAIHCNGYLKVRLDRPAAVPSPSQPQPLQPPLNADLVTVAACSGANGNSIELVKGDGISAAPEMDGDGCSYSGPAAEQLGAKRGESAANQEAEWTSYALVAVGHSLLPTASTEVKLTGNSFMFRANLDLKLYYIESTVIRLLGFEQAHLIGQSLYQLVHLSDVPSLERAHRSLLEKGQVVTKYYRLMRKDGGSIWVQSHATLVNNPRNMPKPQHIVSICLVLGDNQVDESCILGSQQEEQQQKSLSLDARTPCDERRADISEATLSVQQQQQRQLKSQARKLAQAKKIRKVRVQGGFEQLTQRPKSSHNLQQQLQSQSHLVKRSSKDERSSSNSASCAASSSSSGGGSSSSSRSSFIGCNNPFVQQQHQLDANQCSCLLPSYAGNPGISANCHQEHRSDSASLNSIGSIRRPSDDSCSVVSSVASTCVSSSSSSRQNSDAFGYTSLSSSSSSMMNEINGGGYSGDHLLAYSTNQTYPNKSSGFVAGSFVDLQQQHQIESSPSLLVAPAQLTTSGSIFYDEFNQQQLDTNTNTHYQHHLQTTPLQVNESTLTQSEHHSLVTQSMGADEDRLVGFNQQVGNQSYCNAQSSPDWQPQVSNCSHLAGVQYQTARTHTVGACHHYPNNTVDEERLSGYSETSSIGSSSYYMSHQSPPYIDNARTTIHYQQVPVNNGYLM